MGTPTRDFVPVDYGPNYAPPAEAAVFWLRQIWRTLVWTVLIMGTILGLILWRVW